MWSLAVPADIQRGDAVSDDRPSGPHDALSVRTRAFEVKSRLREAEKDYAQWIEEQKRQDQGYE